jgi:CubicO group peptidase (beta-lactamase class C family)
MDTMMLKQVGPQTQFKLASISKLMLSTLIMKLQEEGRLGLNQKLGTLLPEFPNKKAGDKITLRHILSHTSGLPEYSRVIDSAYVKTRVAPTRHQLLDFFKGNPLLFQPGSQFCYNNSGFLLAGLIVERITGRSLQSEFDRVIAGPARIPLELITTARNNPELSQYFELHGENLYHEPHWDWIKGDGGLTSTSIALARFPFIWARGDLIGEDSFNEMTRPNTLSDSTVTGYGLGVRLGNFLGHRMIGHTGGHKSILSKMAYFPDDQISIAIVVNTDNTPVNARKIFGQVALAVFELAPPDYSAVPVVEKDYGRLAGAYIAYGLKNSKKINITWDSSTATLAYCEEADCEMMIPVGDHSFRIAKWPLDLVSFDMDGAGYPRALKEYYTGDFVALRRPVSATKGTVPH